MRNALAWFPCLSCLVCLTVACGGHTTVDGDASIADGSIPDATVFIESGGCGGNDTGCGCGQAPPVFDAGETLESDLALFDGAAPDGACPPLTFGVPWGGAPITGATLFRGCQNTTLFMTSSCAGGLFGDGVSEYLVFDLQGKLVGATQMSKSNCVSTGPAPDYVPCGADAAPPPTCQVLCGCDNWGCRRSGDAGTVTDGSAD